MGEDAVVTRHTVRDVEQRPDEAGTSGADADPDAAIADGNLTELEEDSPPPTPRFLQEAGAWKRWKWVPYPARRFYVVAKKWSRGPPDARDFGIEPVLPGIQHAPLRLLDRYLPEPRFRKWRIALYAGWLGLWLMTFALVMRLGLQSTYIHNWGEPGTIRCGDTFWMAGNQCGIDGNDCRPFDGSGFAFRCPANCASYELLNFRAVGDLEIIYQTLVVGGPANDSDTHPIYRGDSFICSAAIHAGVISNAAGGCGVVQLAGKQRQYVGSERNGISSVAFGSHFPLSFTFEQGVDCQAVDMRWPLLAVSVVFSAALSLFVSSPAPFFFAVFSGLFWHVGLASDPPPHSSTADLISTVIGRYMPALFAAWVVYDKMAVRRTLTRPDGPGGEDGPVARRLLGRRAGELHVQLHPHPAPHPRTTWPSSPAPAPRWPSSSWSWWPWPPRRSTSSARRAASSSICGCTWRWPSASSSWPSCPA